MIVGPAEPGLGATGTGPKPCGPIIPVICANACVGAKPMLSDSAAMAQRQNLPKPHPAIPAFLGFNRGNFKPNRPLGGGQRRPPDGGYDLLREQN
jgi:hypothetical protein